MLLLRCVQPSPEWAAAAGAGSMRATSNPPAPAATARGAVLSQASSTDPSSRPPGLVRQARGAAVGDLSGSGTVRMAPLHSPVQGNGTAQAARAERWGSVPGDPMPAEDTPDQQFFHRRPRDAPWAPRSRTVRLQ